MYIPSTRKAISSYDVVIDESFSSELSYTSRPYSKAMVMRLAVTYTLYATSSKEQTDNVITFAQFDEENILTETSNDAETCDKSDNEFIMMREQDMDNLDSNEKSDHDLISTEMLEDIRDGSQTHPNVNKSKERYKIFDHVRQKESQWKGALKATKIMGKGLHKVFSTIVKEISQEFTALGESGSEVSHFITEPINFAEVKKLS